MAKGPDVPEGGGPAPPWVYVAASLPLATVAYLAVQVAYLLEQSSAGLVAMPSLTEIAVGTITVHGASFAAWLVLASAAGLGACRIASALYRSQRRVIAVREAQALRDPLTGLHNRRAMNDRLAFLDATSERSGHPYAVVAIDADGLKRINDTFGHEAGDAAIREVAETLRTTARAVDDCIRLGGDEFVVLLPETELAGAVLSARRLLAALRDRRAGRVELADASMGVAVWQHGLAGGDVLKRADAALYRAKRDGKGRVFADTPPPELRVLG